MSFRAEFLAPPIESSPRRRRPPVTSSLSTRGFYAAIAPGTPESVEDLHGRKADFGRSQRLRLDRFTSKVFAFRFSLNSLSTLPAPSMAREKAE
jgi:hypothetical protein